MERMTAIDTALIKGNQGCSRLEASRPMKQDLEEAAEAFKDAANIIKASLVLMDHDVYQVQAPPQQPGVPLFKPTGEPSSVVPKPPVTDEEKEAFENLAREDQDAIWHEALARARSIFLSQPGRTAEDWIPVSKPWIRAMGTWGNGEDVDVWAALEDLLRAGDTAFDVPVTCGDMIEPGDGQEPVMCSTPIFGEAAERGFCQGCGFARDRKEREAKKAAAKAIKPKKASKKPKPAPDPLENDEAAS